MTSLKVFDVTVGKDSDSPPRTLGQHARIGLFLIAAIAGMPLAACGAGDGGTSQMPMQTAAVDQPKAGPMRASYKIGESSVGNYLAGRYAQKSRDYAAAARLLGDALKADPKNRELLRRAFVANLASGQLEEAWRLAERVVAVDHAAPLANLALVSRDIKKGAFDRAEKRLESMGNRGLNAFMVPLLEAWARVGQGRTDDGLAALSKLEDISGFAVIHDLHAGLILDLAGRKKAAEKRYLEALHRAPRETVRLIQAVGSFYERTGRKAEAEKQYRAFLSDNNESLLLDHALRRLKSGGVAPPLVANAAEGAAEVFFNVAGTLLQENSIEVALVYGRLALELRPKFALAKVLVGRVLESVGRVEDAIALYDTVDKTSPLWWSAKLRRADALESIGRDDEAIAQLREMAKERTGRADALADLGDILRAKKRYAEAVSAYDAAIKRIGTMERHHWTLLYSRGIALERSNQWARAEKDFIAALELNPDQPYVLNYLGYSWVDQGIHLDRARSMIERAVELRPNDGYIVDSLGWVLYRLGKYGGAVKNLERAVELRPEDPTINDHLGDAYWKVGRHNEARFQWRRALTLDPEPDQVSIIRKKIDRGLVEAKAAAKTP